MLALGAAVVALTALATTASGASHKHYAVSGNLSMVGIWTGPEQKNFQAVLDAFQKKFPGVKVKYTSAGDNTPTVLSTAIAGGNPPDVAAVGQPGLVQQFSARKAIKPMDYVKPPDGQVVLALLGQARHLQRQALRHGLQGRQQVDRVVLGAGLQERRREPAQDLDAALAAAKTLRASGVPAYSIGGADGWTLTDLFENIYLRQAGAGEVRPAPVHKIKWTDPSVKAALKTMAACSATPAISTAAPAARCRPTSRLRSTTSSPRRPKAAIVMEGDFVPGASDHQGQAGQRLQRVSVPVRERLRARRCRRWRHRRDVQGQPGIARARLVPGDPGAATIWAQKGGFSSPNKGVPGSAYPDAVTRKTATALALAKTFRFDMSDLAPSAFGGTASQGEWKILQDFLKNPKDVNGTASKLEAAAAAAYKK